MPPEIKSNSFKSIFDYNFVNCDGENETLAKYKGKVILLVLLGRKSV